LTVPHNNGAVKTAPYEKMQSEIRKMRRGITRHWFPLRSKKPWEVSPDRGFFCKAKKPWDG